MIKIICVTNIDGQFKFPTAMACRPEKGDLVDCGNAILRVCRITHKIVIDCDGFDDPYLEIELTK